MGGREGRGGGPCLRRSLCPHLEGGVEFLGGEAALLEGHPRGGCSPHFKGGRAVKVEALPPNKSTRALVSEAPPRCSTEEEEKKSLSTRF